MERISMDDCYRLHHEEQWYVKELSGPKSPTMENMMGMMCRVCGPRGVIRKVTVQEGDA